MTQHGTTAFKTGKRTRAMPPADKGKWKAIHLVHVYRHIRSGLTEQETYHLLGISHQGWANWKKRLPELRETLRLAYEARDGEFSLADYCYQRLPAELRQIWDKIKAWEQEESGVAKIEMILADSGKRVKQLLYLHALVDSHFSPSKAMSRLGIKKAELDAWIESEPEFAELVMQVDWHRRNFGEEALMKSVAAGVPRAVVFFNQTLNADRGYRQESVVNMKHSGQIQHNVLDLAELLPYLSVEAREGILDGLRRLEADKLARTPRQLTVEEAISRQISATEVDYEGQGEGHRTQKPGQDGSVLGGSGAEGQGVQVEGPA